MRLVIPSVDYGDCLALTLPAWLKFFPPTDITIVTSLNDKESSDLARKYRTKLVETNAWYSHGCVFNKGRALDEAFKFPLEDGELCLSTDADAYPDGQFPKVIEPNVLYGANRTDVHSSADLKVRLRLPFQRHDNAEGVLGFFHLFRYYPGLKFGTCVDASVYDRKFKGKFPKNEIVKTLRIFHLGTRVKNWRGRVTPRFS